ncbi:MAG: O-antigen ligase family protein [Pseudomonadota bacterium]
MESFSGNLLVVLGVFAAVLFFFILLYKGDIVFGFLVWFLAASFIPRQIFVISFPGWPDIYLERLIFVLLFIIFLFEVLRGKEKLLPNTRIEYFMMVLLVILLISMGQTGFLAIRGDEYQPFHIFLTGFLFPFTFYYFGKTVLSTEPRIKILLWGLFLFFSYLVLTAYLEHFKITRFIFPRYISDPLLGIHYGRARGPFGVAPVNGWILASLFCTTLYLRSQTKGLISRGIMLIILLLTPVAIFYTYTRAVWLSFLLAPILLMLFSKKLLFRPRYFVFPIICLILLIFFNWENIASKERALGGVMQLKEIEARTGLYNATKAIFRDTPFFGVGFGRFGRVLPFYAPEAFPGTAPQLASQHNLFFGLLSEVGLIGLTPFVLILYFIIRDSILLFKKLGEEKGFFSRDPVVVFWAIISIYLVNAFFIQTQFFIQANGLVFLWAGLVVGFYQRQVRLTPDSK